MIVFPKTVDEVLEHEGEIRAGGTDLQERRHLRIATGPLVDLRDVAGLQDIEVDPAKGVRVGARTTIAAVARAQTIRDGYPGFAEAAGGLATPQIRVVGTIGGNLLQRTRCWYFRNRDAECLKRGGSQCSARAGDHLFHGCFDRGPCVSVHPSTLGMAALAYEASVEVTGAPSRTVEELYGDGSNPAAENTLEPGALLTHLVLPPPAKGEQSAYFRSISRARAEWPLVEVLARLVVEDGSIRQAAIAVGGVAPVPLRLPEVEAALVGGPASPPRLAKASSLSSRGAEPLPMTAYKVALLQDTVLETLERAAAREPTKPSQTRGSKLPSSTQETNK